MFKTLIAAVTTAGCIVLAEPPAGRHGRPAPIRGSTRSHQQDTTTHR